MNNLTSRFRFSLIAIAALASAFAGAQTVLPTLGNGGLANDANNAGVIVGLVSEVETFRSRPAVWNNDVLSTLSTGSFGSGYASAISDNGIIGGVLLPEFGQTSRAAMWQNGQLQVLPDLGFGSAVHDVNSAGTAVGWVKTDESTKRAAIWKNGALSLLPLLEGPETNSYATSINESGKIVGLTYNPTNTDKTAVVWNDESISPIISNFLESRCFGINESGTVTVTGYDSVTGSLQLVVVDSNSNPTVLGSFDNQFYGFVSRINGKNQAAGWAYRTGEDVYAQLRPVVWTNAQPEELPTTESRFVGFAQGLNDNGIAVGYQWDIRTGESMPVKWAIPNVDGTGSNPPAPAPEPTLTLTPLAAFPGEQVTLQARVSEPASRSQRSSSSTRSQRRSVKFVLDGRTVGTVQADANGNARMMYTVPKDQEAGGSDFMASLGGSQYVQAPFEVKEIATSMQTRNASVRPGRAVTLTATLSSSQRSQSMARQSVTFNVNGQSITGQTNGRGVATVRWTAPRTATAGSTVNFSAQFAGNKNHSSSQASGTVRIQ